jgi:hypothetical protein
MPSKYEATFPKVLSKREIKDIKKKPVSSYVDVVNLLATLDEYQAKLERLRKKNKKLKEKLKENNDVE